LFFFLQEQQNAPARGELKSIESQDAGAWRAAKR